MKIMNQRKGSLICQNVLCYCGNLHCIFRQWKRQQTINGNNCFVVYMIDWLINEFGWNTYDNWCMKLKLYWIHFTANCILDCECTWNAFGWQHTTVAMVAAHLMYALGGGSTTHHPNAIIPNAHRRHIDSWPHKGHTRNSERREIYPPPPSHTHTQVTDHTHIYSS